MSLWSSPMREIKGQLNSENVTSISDVIQAIIVVILLLVYTFCLKKYLSLKLICLELITVSKP